ncbi:MAG: DNA repair protein RadA [bacterium]
MPKIKINYVCQQCGFTTPKWLGKCPDCNQWNSFTEEIEDDSLSHGIQAISGSNSPQLLHNIKIEPEERMNTGLREFDLVLGGGIIPGSLILIGGEPGIGKSTLLLQTADELGKKYGKILYISGEESLKQIKYRAERLSVTSEFIYLLSENILEVISDQIQKNKPKLVIIDSIQSIYKNSIPASPGTITQIRECASHLMSLAKNESIATFIIGHVTKDGALAGPKTLEHLVDTVLYFEGDLHHNYRILRTIKNRFGKTSEVAIFSMEAKGLTEVSNPSSVFITERPKKTPGSVITVMMEGTRPILVEIQALVSPSSFNIPQRKSTGIDYSRLILIIAVLEKRLGLCLSSQDIFVNVTGGLDVSEPSADLGIAMAIFSSFRNIPLDEKTVLMGEIGLGGEVRSINYAEQRINEAEKLGFQKIVLPKYNLKNINKIPNITFKGISSVEEATEFG